MTVMSDNLFNTQKPQTQTNLVKEVAQSLHNQSFKVPQFEYAQNDDDNDPNKNDQSEEEYMDPIAMDTSSTNTIAEKHLRPGAQYSKSSKTIKKRKGSRENSLIT
jgi:hypothetical protein